MRIEWTKEDEETSKMLEEIFNELEIEQIDWCLI